MKLRKTTGSGAGRRRFDGMRLIRGGEFRMGAGAFYADEYPERSASVGDFWIDQTPITNDQFARFVAATGHVTVAQIAPDPADYPGMAPQMARAGSAVFTPPLEASAGPVGADTEPTWWRFVFGADWRRPTGPGGGIEEMGAHPVVHVALADALAYCRWAGKVLPNEAEWEYAARGGLDGATYAWGDELEPGGRAMAKTWRGEFPAVNLAPAGLERTAPVRSYPPNGHGLFDMIGNVWEWTADPYAAGGPDAARPCCGSASRPRAGGGRDRSPPIQPIPRRVLKGGSHLCAPNYCQRYRPAARWAQPIDTSASHVGFRCIVRR